MSDVLPPVNWGPLRFGNDSYRVPTLHFLVVGSTGSGKTTLIKQLMASALNHSSWKSGCRALIYDAKRDIIPFLYALGLDDHLTIANPMDRRSKAWAMSRDVTNPIEARQVATLLVPEDRGGNGSSLFFDQACREILLGIMLVLMQRGNPGETWTLRDVIGGALDPKTRSALLNSEVAMGSNMVRRIRNAYVNVANPQLRENINSSLNTRVGIYEPIAALWDEAGKRNGYFSIEEWAHGDRDVLVLGNDEAARASIDALNAVLFKRVAECLLSKPEVRDEDLRVGQGRSWVILDEVREAGNLDGLRSILNKGRSKGACVVIGIQDIEGLRAEYGREQANEIAGQCNTVAVLRVVNPDTAEWASGLFGQVVQTVKSSGMSMGESTGFQSSASTQIRPRVTTSHFLDLTPGSPASGLQGFFYTPGIQAAIAEKRYAGWDSAFKPCNVPWSIVTSGVPAPSSNPEHAAYIPYDSARHQYLRQHDEAELRERFGIEPSKQPGDRPFTAAEIARAANLFSSDAKIAVDK